MKTLRSGATISTELLGNYVAQESAELKFHSTELTKLYQQATGSSEKVFRMEMPFLQSEAGAAELGGKKIICVSPGIYKLFEMMKLHPKGVILAEKIFSYC